VKSGEGLRLRSDARNRKTMITQGERERGYQGSEQIPLPPLQKSPCRPKTAETQFSAKKGGGLTLKKLKESDVKWPPRDSLQGGGGDRIVPPRDAEKRVPSR